MAGQNGDTVVIAVDASPFAEEALRWYFVHFHRPENTVVLTHCMEMPSMPSRDTWERQTQEGRQKGSDLEAQFRAMPELQGVSCQFVFDFEKPGEFIVATANKVGATVIVMGTRGMGKVRRTILGSVSNYVLNHAGCPVLVCRSQANGKRRTSIKT